MRSSVGRQRGILSDVGVVVPDIAGTERRDVRDQRRGHEEPAQYVAITSHPVDVRLRPHTIELGLLVNG